MRMIPADWLAVQLLSSLIGAPADSRDSLAQEAADIFGEVCRATPLACGEAAAGLSGWVEVQAAQPREVAQLQSLSLMPQTCPPLFARLALRLV